MINHHRTLSYHPQADGEVESFNKTLTKGLTKIYDIDKDDQEDRIIAILWDYIASYKRSTNQTSFNGLQIRIFHPSPLQTTYNKDFPRAQIRHWINKR